MEERIAGLINDSIETKKLLVPSEISTAAKVLITALKNKHKVLICGNGGSASQAQHFSAELVGRFEKERTALPAIALTTDTSIITAVGNDYGFEKVFSRQVEALGQQGDVLITLSTSGNSKNIIAAIETALNKKMEVINLLGKDGGIIAKFDWESELISATQTQNIIIPSSNTARIQESHLLIIHILCKLIEDEFFKK
ncbi:SIS domain-containing protein [Candidatus Woesearchaeota archaeon]|nr:SIS domain-containing protein [Candidatus Woesearchaeota archaeon]